MPVIEAPPHSDEARSSTPHLPEDGKGGTASTPKLKAGASYIYYRMYTKDGPLESINPIYSNDRFIGRISPRSVRPPHTAASLKKYICNIEGVSATNGCTLYQSLSEQTAVEDSAVLSSRGTIGPGLSDRNPMALVFDARAVAKRLQTPTTGDPTKLMEREWEQHYVYYLIYNDVGEVLSKTSFDEDSPVLGRVGILSIPPPHTVSSLKNLLIKSEEIWGYNVQLFEDEDGESIMDDSDVIAIFADNFPGFLEDQPIAVAYESQGLGTKSPADNEDPNEKLGKDLHTPRSAFEELQISNEAHKRELAQMRAELENAKEAQAHELAQVRAELKQAKETHTRDLGEIRQGGLQRPSFTLKLRAIKSWNHSLPGWHQYHLGDIFYTDGIRKEKPVTGCGLNGYQAISSSGILALVYANDVAFC